VGLFYNAPEPTRGHNTKENKRINTANLYIKAAEMAITFIITTAQIRGFQMGSSPEEVISEFHGVYMQQDIHPVHVTAVILQLY